MSRINALVNSFTSGEITPRLNARVDTTKYRTGLRVCENFIVMPHGGVMKRGGTKFVAPTKSGATALDFIEFQFNTEQTYMLEFGYASAGYIRFFTNGGILTSSTKTITGATQANPCVITATSHGFSNGDWVLITGVVGMTELNNRHFQVANQTTNTFELTGVNSSAYVAYSSGGTASKIYEVATSFTASDITDGIGFAQSADTLYLAHPAHALQKLERFAATTWTISDVDIENGPFRRINGDDDNKITVALTSISKTITAATQASPCVITTSTAHGLLDNACIDIASVSGMTELNSNTYSVRVLTTTTLALYDELGQPIDSTGFTTYTSGGTATQANSRFGTYPVGSQVTLTAVKDTFESDMVGARWRLWEPGKGSGVQAPVWSSTGTGAIVDNGMYTHDGKIYGIANPNISYWHFDWQYPKHEKGVVRIIAVVGGAEKYHDSVYLHDSSCDLIITAYASATSVTAKVVKNHVPKSVLDARTSFWEEGAWSEKRGYPSLPTFNEQRLWATSNSAEPQTVWASRSGLFEDFQDGADDDRALIYKVATDKVEVPAWLLPGKVMAMGTASGVFSIGSNTQQDAMTPSNVRIVRQSNWGAAVSKALRIGNSALYIQKDRRRLREFAYQFDSDSFVSADLTILSEHLGQSRFMSLTSVQSPNPIIWVRREDGTFAGLTYEKEQEVLGWHRHTLGGPGASIQRAGAIEGSSGDEKWMIVNRTIDGGTKSYVEMLTTPDIGVTSKADFTYLDCHLTYDGTATDTVSGLNHLEGETVSVLADGAVHPNVTVAGGRVTLNYEASVIHIGYGYTSILETMDLEAGAQGGTAHGRPKRIANAVVRFYRSLGGKLGVASQMDQILFRRTADVMDASPSLFSGFKKVEFPTGWEDEAIVRIEHDQPLPCNVLSVTVDMNVTG